MICTGFSFREYGVLMSKKLSRIEKRKKVIEEQLAAVKAMEKSEKRAVARRGRAAEAREAKAFRKVDARMMIIMGSWLCNELRKAGEGDPEAARLKRLFDADFDRFVGDKDKKFVSDNLKAVVEKRCKKGSKKGSKREGKEVVIPPPIARAEDGDVTVISSMPPMPK
jgi:hypothetical protein